MEDNKKLKNEEVSVPEEAEVVILPDQKLKKVTGGGFGDDIPRVPENPIDDDVKDKF